MIAMKQIKKYFLIILILFSLQNCNKPNVNFLDPQNDDENVVVESPRTADDVRVDFQNFDFHTGINDVTLESTSEGLFWSFRVIVPVDASETNKKPLIFNLHGGAQNIAPDAHKSTDCLISPGLDGIIDAYIISPNSNGKLWYDQSNQIQILALYDLATSYLPIDMNRIAITGYSDGGNGSWFYSQYFSSMFSAAIPMATSYNTAKSNGSVEKINIPLYVIHGANDLLFPVETTQAFVDASKSAGSDIQFVIAPNLSHNEVCDYVPYLRDAAQWLATIWN
jgi:predicted peptidase